MKQRANKLCGVALVFVVLGTASLRAAFVKWDAPETISGAGDVNTTGSYFGSWAPYDPLPTNHPINGVIFYGDDLGITYSGFASGSQTFGAHTTPDANYDALLPFGIYSDGTNASFTVNGDGTRPLVVGRQYLIQVWVSDSRGLGQGRIESISGSPALSFHTDSGIGQYLLGRFTADAASQTFTLSGNITAQINLMQVRDLAIGLRPSVNALANHSALSIGQTIFVRASVNYGSSPTMTNVTLDASSIGASEPITLRSAGGNVYTNSVIVGPGTVYGNQTLLVTATDGAGLQGQSTIEVFLPMPAPYKATTKALEMWRSNRFGMFIHWGPATLTGQEISWSRANSNPQCPNDGLIPVEVYDQLYKQFSPTNFNADNWVATAKAAGMKYIVLTAKHHDGFLLWDSKASTYNIMNSPLRRDVCRELADAVHAAGLGLGWYFSPPDWKDPRCRNAHNADFVKTMQAELRELLSNYGKVDLLWFDYDERTNSFDVANTYAMCRRLQPDIVLNNRLDLASKADYAAQPPVGPWADYYTPEQRIGAFDNQNPLETCMTLGTQWSWMPDDAIKSVAQSLSVLLQCAGGDGNLLYDLGPQPTGAFEKRYVDVVAGIGRWLAQNGESVYGTRGGPYLPTANFSSTRKDNVIYLHFMPPQKIITLSALPATILSATALTVGEAIFTQTVNSVILDLPNGTITSAIATVKLVLAGSAMTIPPRPAAVSAIPGTAVWQAAQTITGSSDVNTQGTLVMACQASATNYGGYSDQTINGVQFQGNVNTANGVTFTMIGQSGYDPSTFISTRTFSGPDAGAYGRMLAGAWFSVDAEPMAVSFNGLTWGHTYLIQTFVADYRAFPNVRTETVTIAEGSTVNSPMLNFLTGDGFSPGSGTGQYAIARFTAPGPSVTFVLAGNESSQLNAFQLRDLTPSAAARLKVSMVGTNVTLSWPAAYIGWTLQVQTNVVSTETSTNWVNVPGSDSGNTNVITISPGTPPAFYRLQEPR